MDSDDQKWYDLMDTIKNRPRMWMLAGSFPEICALMRGFDMATTTPLLKEFRDWLVLRSGKRSNLGFPSLIIRETLRIDGPAVSLTPAQDRVVADATRILFKAFLRERLSTDEAACTEASSPTEES